MILVKAKQKISIFFITILILSQFGLTATYLFTPRPAQAFLGFGDITFNTTVVDIAAYVKQIAEGILEKIAVNYANKYLTRFVQQVSDKYRIKDFLFYDKYLSNYYITNAILKNVSDPNLRQALNLTTSLYITGQYQAFCSKQDPATGKGYATAATCTAAGGAWNDPRSALVPQLKLAINKLYISQGGIDPTTVYSPGSGVSDIQYFASAQAYFSNPQSFTAQNLNAEFGAYQSEATTASQLEVAAGNGLKAGRIIGGTCSTIGDTTNTSWGNTNGTKGWDPVSCAAAGGQWNESALDVARDLITNPTSFIDKNIDKAVGSIFGNNFDASNIYVQIGQALGNFLFSKLDLNSSGNTTSGTLSDSGSYDPNGYNNNANASNIATIDLDHDGIPDVQDNNNNHVVDAGDTCYFGEVTVGAVPLNCITSTSPAAVGSDYFAPFCKAVNDAINQMDAWVKYQEDHAYQIKNHNAGGPFNDETDFGPPDGADADAQLWGEVGSNTEGSISALMNALRGLNSSDDGVDKIIVQLNRYNVWLNEVDQSLFKDSDTDLQKGPGIGGGGFNNLLAYSKVIQDYVKRIKATVANCSQPAVGNVTDPTVPDGILYPPDPTTDCSPVPTAAQQQAAQNAANYMIPLLNALPEMNPVQTPEPASYQAAAQAIIDQANALYPGTAGVYYPDGNVIGLTFNYIVGPATFVVSNQIGIVTSWTNIWRVTCAVGAAPAGGGGPSAPANALALHPDQSAVVAAAKAQLASQGMTWVQTDPSFECNRLAITQLAAQMMGGGAGLLIKPAGTNCSGFATDIIAYSDGYIFDVLNGGASDGAGPMWNPDGCVGASSDPPGTCPERYSTA